MQAQRNGCVFTADTILSIVKPLPTVTLTIPSGLFACNGDQITLVANTGLSNYTFIDVLTGGADTVIAGPQAGNIYTFTPPAGNKTYQVTASQNGCEATSNIANVAVAENPSFTFVTNDLQRSICDTGVYQITVSNTNLSSYEYIINGTTFTSGSNIFVDSVYNDTVTVQVRGTNSAGCSAISNSPVDTLRFPIIQLNLDLVARNTIDPCNLNEQFVPLEIQATRIANGDTDQVSGQNLPVLYGGSFIWNRATLTGATAVLSSIDDLDSSFATTFTAADGCVFTSDTFTLQRDQSNFLNNRDSVFTTCTDAGFITLSADTAAKFVSWTGTGINGSNEIAPTILLEKPGNYVFNATQCGNAVSDTGTCCNVKTFTICVAECSEPFVPDAISPNNDAANDVWIVNNFAGSDVQIRVQIFNRWGNMVYTNPDYQNDWGGTDSDGNELPDGVYLYIIDAAGTRFCENDNTTQQFRGNLLIQR